MNTQVGSIFRTREYKDCAIWAASYQVASDDWVPEACFWHYTDGGWKRLWIKSFEHLFGLQGLTFSSQEEADNYAFRFARSLIDRALPDLRELPAKREIRWGSLPKLLRRERLRRTMRKIIKEFRNHRLDA
jgi:hypothetical protein